MMIEFNPITIETKEIYSLYLPDANERGCETTFANLVMWGFQQYAIVHNQLVLFSLYNGHHFYSYPIGEGDKKAAMDAIMADAKERGVSCCIVGLYGDATDVLNNLYPEQFTVKEDRDSFDYVYDINDLADLQGRKYHKKRTHYNHFHKAFPQYRVEPLSNSNVANVKPMIEKWYADRLNDNPDNDYRSEIKALEKALMYYEELNLEGLMLLDNDTDFDNEHILAVTFASRLSDDTFDVHFEKARWDVDGAYTVINNEFAKYIRDKYPDIRFLNREEDMGLEGLRRSKERYYPHHMVEKSKAYLKEL